MIVFLFGCDTGKTIFKNKKHPLQITNSPDLDDREVRKYVLSIAINDEKLRKQSTETSTISFLFHPPNIYKPYTGWVKQIHENGQVWGLGRYLAGKLEGSLTIWRKTGQKWKEVHFRKGVKDGRWTAWYENGQKAEEGFYGDGSKEGLWTSWQQTGQKWREVHFRAGQKDGVCRYFNKNAAEDHREIYKAGFLIRDNDLIFAN